VQESVLQISDGIHNRNANNGQIVIESLALNDSHIDGRNYVKNEGDKSKQGKNIEPEAIVSTERSEKSVINVIHYIFYNIFYIKKFY
jgi:hypothetical protein